MSPDREMTAEELVEAAEKLDVIDRAITIPATWPRLILERSRSSEAAPDELRAALAEVEQDVRGAAEKGGDFTDGAEWVVSRMRYALSRTPAEPGPPGGLDAAWAEAEAALPEGEQLGGVRLAVLSDKGETWEAGCSVDAGGMTADGPTPAAALRALAARLAASTGEPR